MAAAFSEKKSEKLKEEKSARRKMRRGVTAPFISLDIYV
jgi:hypothetical protein